MNDQHKNSRTETNGMTNVGDVGPTGWPHTYTSGSTSRLNPSHEERRRSRSVKDFLVGNPPIWDEAKVLFETHFSFEVLSRKMLARKMGAAPIAREGLFSRLSLMAEALLAKRNKVPQAERLNRDEALLILFGERSMTDPDTEFFEDASQLRRRIASIAEERKAWADLVDEAHLWIQEGLEREEASIGGSTPDWENRIRKRISDERKASRAVEVYAKLLEASDLILRAELESICGLAGTTADSFYISRPDPGAKVGGGSGGDVKYKRDFLLDYVEGTWKPKRKASETT